MTKSSFDQGQKKKKKRFVLTNIHTNRHHTSWHLQFFGSDLYYPALGYHQGTISCFTLKDIHTNQQSTSQEELYYKEKL